MTVGRGHLQSQVVVVLELLVLEALSEVLGDNRLNPNSILASQWVVAAVALVVHVVSPDVPSDLCVLVHPFQLLALGVTVVF